MADQKVYYLDPDTGKILYLPKTDSRVQKSIAQNVWVWSAPDNDASKAYVSRGPDDHVKPADGWYKAMLYAPRSDAAGQRLAQLEVDANHTQAVGVDDQGHAVLSPRRGSNWEQSVPTPSGGDAKTTVTGAKPILSGNTPKALNPTGQRLAAEQTAAGGAAAGDIPAGQVAIVGGQPKAVVNGNLTGVTKSATGTGYSVASAAVGANPFGGSAGPFGANPFGKDENGDPLNPDVVIGVGKAASKLPAEDQDPAHRQYTQTQSLPANELLTELLDKTPGQISDLQDQLQRAGYMPRGALKSGEVDSDTASAYVKLLADASSAQQGKGASLTTLDQYLASKVAAGDKGTGKSKTTTSSKVDLTDPTTAQGILLKAMQDHLGRQPSQQDIADFTSALNAAQTGNPTVSQTSGQYDSSALAYTGDTSTTTGGGLDPNQFADNYVLNRYGTEAGTDQVANVYAIAMKSLGLPAA